ncbi:MAG: DUF4349 domain-containing protein [Gemmatimonadaceae bacterium]
MSRIAILRGVPAAARNPLAAIGTLIILAFVVLSNHSLASRGEVAQSYPASTASDMAAPPRAAAAPEADFSARGMTRQGRVAGVQVTGVGSSGVQLPTQLPVTPDALIIRNGHVVVEVDSLEPAIERVRQLAISLGGSIGNLSMHLGEAQVRSATIEMKVPAARFDDALTGLPPIGDVEQSNATAQDIGEEFVDISARVANAKRLEQRLIDLLANRTGRLDDVLAVERELARVREEIERYEGRLRFLSSRVATSTIVAVLHEPRPLVASTPGTNIIAEAFRDMWRNFVGFIATMIESLGLLIPVAVLAWIAWRATRRWRSATAGSPAPSPLRDTPA